MELEVPITPVDLPLSACLRVSQPGDRDAGPLQAELRPPRGATLENRRRSGVDVDLVSDLIPGTLR